MSPVPLVYLLLCQGSETISFGPDFQTGDFVQLYAAVVMGEGSVLLEVPGFRLQRGVAVGDVVHVVHGVSRELEVRPLDLIQSDEA